MSNRIELAGLSVARELKQFIADEALPGTGIDEAAFWQSFSAIVHELAPKNRALLAKREVLQDGIDRWHRDNGAPSDLEAYKNFLQEIGYLLPEGPAFQVSTGTVDPEIAAVAGPQLVVPVMNARYALNAANARWGSLYDALYGTDAIPETDGAERARATIPAAATRSSPGRRTFSTEQRRSTAPAGPMYRRCRSTSMRSPSRAVASRQAARRRAICRLSWRARRARCGAAEKQRPAHRDRHRPQQCDRQD